MSQREIASKLKSLRLTPGGAVARKSSNPEKAMLPELRRWLGRNNAHTAGTEETLLETYLSGRPESTRQAYQRDLDRIARELSRGQLGASHFPWGELRFASVRRLVESLSRELAPTSVNRALSALRGLLEAAWRMGVMPDEAYRRIVVRSVVTDQLTAGRYVAPDEMEKLVAACGAGTRRGARDSALLALLYGCGLRRFEAVALDVGDVDFESGFLLVRRGKGRKSRSVPMSDMVRSCLGHWLSDSNRGLEPGPLLHPVSGGDSVLRRRMAIGSVGGVLRALARAAGVKAFTPHDLRRSCASDLLDRGVDGLLVSQILGHERLDTTRLYDRRPKDRLLAAVAVLDQRKVEASG